MDNIPEAEAEATSAENEVVKKTGETMADSREDLEGPFRSRTARQLCMKLYGSVDPSFMTMENTFIAEKRRASNTSGVGLQERNSQHRLSLPTCTLDTGDKLNKN